MFRCEIWDLGFEFEVWYFGLKFETWSLRFEVWDSHPASNVFSDCFWLTSFPWWFLGLRFEILRCEVWDLRFQSFGIWVRGLRFEFGFLFALSCNLLNTQKPLTVQLSCTPSFVFWGFSWGDPSPPTLGIWRLSFRDFQRFSGLFNIFPRFSKIFNDFQRFHAPKYLKIFEYALKISEKCSKEKSIINSSPWPLEPEGSNLELRN